MDEPTGMKAEVANARLSWMTICLWLAALFVFHDYAFRFVASSHRPMSHPVGTSILLFLLALAVFYLAGLIISGLVWRRLPRAKGLLIALSIYACIHVAILTTDTSGTRRTSPADQQPEIGARAEASGAQIINHQAAGNLRSDHAVGCISISSARNVYTPSDLYKGVAECVGEKQFQAGVRLHALAGVYGAFDALRVSDRTAHQAVRAVQFEAFRSIPEAESALFSQELRRTIQDKQALADICNTIRELGPPNYHPVYMIQHGMRAFTGKGDADIVPGFDQTTAWEKALSSLLHCPAAS